MSSPTDEQILARLQRSCSTSAKALLRRALPLDGRTPLEECREAKDSDCSLPIGCGACGSAYRIGESYCTIKRALPDASLSENCKLSNDFHMHTKLLRAFASFAEIHKLGNIKVNNYICIPDCFEYISKEDEDWWAEKRQCFPSDDQYHEDVLVTEHIPPLKVHITNALIEVYCDEPLQEAGQSQDCNRHCLIRPYLGKQRGTTTRHEIPQACLDLHNYPLHLDQMRHLRLDTASYALVMADALAVMHWGAHIDAANVEFVLGSALYKDPRERVLE